MDTRHRTILRRVLVASVLGCAVGGCAVYAPPYAGYGSYYPAYGYPAYIGPPVSLDFGFGFYNGGYRGRGWGRR